MTNTTNIPSSSSDLPDNWIPASWPAPERIRAGTTTRLGGYSEKPFDSFNLALHVGDETETVLHNRKLLRSQLRLPSEPVWLNQVHGGEVITGKYVSNVMADGCITDQNDIVCAVLTADCVPLLMCDRAGTVAAAIHVGWRGLCRGIVSNAVNKFNNENNRLMAWIGPHVCSRHYPVRADMKKICIDSLSALSASAFEDAGNGYWYADLEKLVRIELENLGISETYSSDQCTYCYPDLFYSYRRNSNTGRLASMIWFENRG